MSKLLLEVPQASMELVSSINLFESIKTVLSELLRPLIPLSIRYQPKNA